MKKNGMRNNVLISPFTQPRQLVKSFTLRYLKDRSVQRESVWFKHVACGPWDMISIYYT